jgi:hypothetical protein
VEGSLWEGRDNLVVRVRWSGVTPPKS